MVVKYILYIAVNFIKVSIMVMQLLMFARAVMSWLFLGEEDEDNKIYKFLFVLTEPIVLPIRNFLNRFEYFANMPMDLSFIAAVLLLYIISAILPAVVL